MSNIPVSTGAGPAAAPAGTRPPAVPALDRLSFGASGACFVHCVTTPILIAALPAATGIPAWSSQFHVSAFVVAILVSTLAIRSGYRRHGLILPALLALVGIALLGVGALAGLSGLAETGFTLGGSLLLVIAHLRNARGRRPAPQALPA